MSAKTKVWTPMNSDMSIKCIEKPKAVWSEWTKCDCETKISRRSRDNETEEKTCPKCEIDGKINDEVEETANNEIVQNCHESFCGDLSMTSSGEPMEFSYCKAQNCDQICCPIVRVTIPTGYTSQA